MNEYTTQMDAARKGIITPQLACVAEKERMTTDELLPLVASGKVVIFLHTETRKHSVRSWSTNVRSWSELFLSTIL